MIQPKNSNTELSNQSDTGFDSEALQCNRLESQFRQLERENEKVLFERGGLGTHCVWILVVLSAFLGWMITRAHSHKVPRHLHCSATTCATYAATTPVVGTQWHKLLLFSNQWMLPPLCLRNSKALPNARQTCNAACRVEVSDATLPFHTGIQFYVIVSFYVSTFCQ